MRHLLTALAVGLALLLGTLSLPAAAQTGSNSNSTQTTQTTRTTETTAQPTTVQVTRSTAQTFNPLWLVIGGLVLVAIIAIALLSARGRSTADSAAVVHERETV